MESSRTSDKLERTCSSRTVNSAWGSCCWRWTDWPCLDYRFMTFLLWLSAATVPSGWELCAKVRRVHARAGVRAGVKVNSSKVSGTPYGSSFLIAMWCNSNPKMNDACGTGRTSAAASLPSAAAWSFHRLWHEAAPTVLSYLSSVAIATVCHTSGFLQWQKSHV